MAELIEKVEKRIKDRTHAETVSMLQDAKIINNEGFLHEDFFSQSDVEKSRKASPIVI